MRSERDAKQKYKAIDFITIFIVLGLVLFGLLTLLNVWADPFTGDEQGFYDIYDNLNFEYVQRQILNFMVGLAGLLVMLVVDYHMYKIASRYVYIAILVLLVILLLTQVTNRGIMAWFSFGAMNLQPSELCKVALIVILSEHVAACMEKDGRLQGIKNIGISLGYFIIPFTLIVLQPDMGTAFVILCLFLCILFVGRISWKYIAGAVAAAGILFPLGYFFILSDSQRERIDVYLNPALADPQDAGMHVMRSKEAIGSGQLYGKGYFTEGTLAQLQYVPESHTDFVFSSIAEGLGFIGGTIVIVVYFLLMFRWLYVALNAKDYLGTCLVVGATGMILAHVFENIGMTIGLMPVTGIPLPFLSYGGSNLLTNMLTVGIVLNVWMRRQQKR